MENDANPRRILVVDDDEHLRKFITRGLSRAGFQTTAAESGSAGIQLLKEQSFDCVLCDLHMPDVDGLDVLRFASGLSPPPPFIVLTGYGSVSVAVEAMKHGASDFLEKPASIDELRGTIQSVLDRRPSAPAAPQQPAKTAKAEGSALGLVGSPRWLDPFLDSLRRIAKTDTTVLIEGETGTGKSAVAREIARLSSRASAPFVELNCAAIPEQLLENELFGHVRGAYSSATGQIGKVEHAAGGVLFLDEVGELKHELQAKLLHLLQERKFTPIGALKHKNADVRFIAATNRNLTKDVEEGRFRADLYFRLNVVSLEIPPLRERREDVPLLVEHFRARIAERHRSPAPEFSKDAVDALGAYRWPGNVRELENLVERMAVMHPEKTIDRALLGTRYSDDPRPPPMQDMPTPTPTPAPAPQPSSSLPPGVFAPPAAGTATSFKEAVQQYEIQMIKAALAAHGGNQTRAAKALNMNRTTLIEKMRKLGIDSDDEGGGEPSSD